MFALTLHIETALSWIFPWIFPRHCLLFDVCEMLAVLWTLIFVHVRDWSTSVRSSWFQAILRHILPHVWCLCGPIFVSKNAAKRWHAFVTVAALVVLWGRSQDADDLNVRHFGNCCGCLDVGEMCICIYSRPSIPPVSYTHLTLPTTPYV